MSPYRIDEGCSLPGSRDNCVVEGCDRDPVYGLSYNGKVLVPGEDEDHKADWRNEDICGSRDHLLEAAFDIYQDKGIIPDEVVRLEDGAKDQRATIKILRVLSPSEKDLKEWGNL